MKILRILLVSSFLFIPITGYSLELNFSTSLYHFNNADLRNYDKTTYEENQAVDDLNTDDQITFLYSTIALKYNTRYKKTEFFVDIYRSGFWGSDNLEGRDEGENDFLFRKLYFSWFPIKDLSIYFGRQFYSIGGDDKDYFFSEKTIYVKDYFFADTIDGVKFDYKINDDMIVSYMVDVLGIAAKPDETRIWFGVGKDEEVMDDHEGDVMSVRTGMTFQAYFVKVFSYYLRYGASSEGGADISENGRNDVNKADGDFLTMNGARIFFDFGSFGKTDVTFAYSYGKDYQFIDDKTYTGRGVSLNYQKEFNGGHVAAFSSGYFQPGFCSMKAQSMGGLLLWAYRGYFASPYAYFYHFKDYSKEEDAPTYVDKTNSKTFVKMEGGLTVMKFIFNLSGLALWETETHTKFAYMGSEIEFSINVFIDNLKFSLVSAVFIPSDYYLNRREDNSYISAGDDPFYGGGFLVTYNLELSGK